MDPRHRKWALGKNTFGDDHIIAGRKEEAESKGCTTSSRSHPEKGNKLHRCFPTSLAEYLRREGKITLVISDSGRRKKKRLFSTDDGLCLGEEGQAQEGRNKGW